MKTLPKQRLHFLPDGMDANEFAWKRQLRVPFTGRTRINDIAQALEIKAKVLIVFAIEKLGVLGSVSHSTYLSREQAAICWEHFTR